MSIAGKFLLKDRIFSKLYGFFHKKPEYSAIINQNVEFPDVSFYQGNINWDVVKTHTLGAIIRAGQNTRIDPQFERNYSEAKRVGLKRGVYWFYDNRVSPQNQANFLINLIKDDRPEMEVFCDWEYEYNTNLINYFDLKYAVQFMQQVESSLPGVRVGMYTGYYFFKDHTNPTTHFVEYDYLKDKPLWLAWYTSNPAYVQIPAPWTRITHWQYTSNGDGSLWGTESGNVDLNWYNGTEQEFKQNYGGVVTPPDPPDTGDGMDEPKIYPSGVTTIEGVLNSCNVRVVIFPYSAIKEKGYLYSSGQCKTSDTIDGYDYVCNFSSFNIYNCRVDEFGLRIGGYEFTPANAAAPPYLALDEVPLINHVVRQFRNYQTVAQTGRYIIQNGIKNPNFNESWNEKAARRFVGTRSNGDLVIIEVEPIDYANDGWTFHEGCDYGLSLGLNMMIDTDGGRSTNSYLLVNGEKKMFWGTPYHDSVPCFLTIKLKEPLVDDITPPDPGSPPYMLEYEGDGTYTGRKWVLEQ